MRLGVQLYTLRAEFERDVAGTLRALADLGVRAVELAGTYGRTAAEFRAMLDDAGLEAIGAHVGLGALRDAQDATLEDARTLGCRFVVLPWISDEDRTAGWAAFGRSLEPIGRAVRDAGLVFAYHNHAFELVSEGDSTGLETLFAACDPAWVQAEIDVGWVRHAGHDPARLVRSLKGRVPLVHLKDFTDDPDALDIEAGKGIVDWDSVLAACAESSVEHGIVELDHPPKAPLESVRECLGFFRSRGLEDECSPSSQPQ